jgi:hypothetical protein
MAVRGIRGEWAVGVSDQLSKARSTGLGFSGSDMPEGIQNGRQPAEGRYIIQQTQNPRKVPNKN